jgi:hypothetical protein
LESGSAIFWGGSHGSPKKIGPSGSVNLTGHVPSSQLQDFCSEDYLPHRVPLHGLIFVLRSWANLTQTWYLLMSTTTMGIDGLALRRREHDLVKRQVFPGHINRRPVVDDQGREYPVSDWSDHQQRIHLGWPIKLTEPESTSVIREIQLGISRNASTGRNALQKMQDRDAQNVHATGSDSDTLDILTQRKGNQF